MEHPAFTFVIEYLSDLHMNCVLTADTAITFSSLDLGLRNSILKADEPASSGSLFKPRKHTIYHITDYYECSYSFFRFPDESKFLFIGPYLAKNFEDSDIRRLMEALRIPSELFPQLQSYYYALPLMTDKVPFLSLLRHLYETAFSVASPDSEYLDLRDLEKQETFLKKHQFHVSEDPVLGMHLLEDRYRIEDELLDAVSHGNTKRALSLAENMGTIRFAPRTGDALRNRKNLIITFNTLLRRTAYEAGVHPFYIDAVSDNYARMIERSDSEDDISDIIPYIIQSYCNLVEKRSMSSYSAPIRQVLVTVDASLTGDLSLSRFANELFLNTSYLSSLFKKEVGMTLTDYVNKNRIEYAKKLLKSTTLSIQDIAASSGIPDIHYFTRLFRRATGMSPRAYRSQTTSSAIP